MKDFIEFIEKINLATDLEGFLYITKNRSLSIDNYIHQCENYKYNGSDFPNINKDKYKTLVLILDSMYLYTAALNKNDEAFNSLKEKGASVNIALYIAAHDENDEAFDFLEKKGASVNVALYIAAHDENDEAFDFLEKKGASVNMALCIAAFTKDDKTFNSLKKKGADVNEALKIAIKKGDTTSIDFFIQKLEVNHVAYTAAKQESSDVLSYIEKSHKKKYDFNDLVIHISKDFNDNDKNQEAYNATDFISDHKKSQRNTNVYIASECALVTVALVTSAIILPLKPSFVVSASMSLAAVTTLYVLALLPLALSGIFGYYAYEHHQQLKNIPHDIETKVKSEKSKAFESLSCLRL